VLDKDILFTQPTWTGSWAIRKIRPISRILKSVEPGYFYVFDESGTMLKKEQYYIPILKLKSRKPVPEIEKEFKGLIEKAFEIRMS